MREIEKLMIEVNKAANNDLVKLGISDFIGGNNNICKKPSVTPEYRIGDNDTIYNIEVICPGLNRKNLSLTEEGRTLKIEYKRTDGNNLYNPNTFTINHRIPYDSDIDNITSEYTDGILKINIPKIKKNPNRIDVK